MSPPKRRTSGAPAHAAAPSASASVTPEARDNEPADGPRRVRRWRAGLDAALARPGPWVAALTFLAAAWHAPLGLHWLDSGELLATGRQLGISHPPGHPLHALLVHAFALLPVGSAASRASWSSALALAVCWGATARLAQALASRHLGVGPRAAAVYAGLACLAGALSASSLLQGVRAEVYALNAALLMEALRTLLVARPGLRQRLRVALLVGLGLANHHFLVVLAGPALVVAWLPRLGTPGPGPAEATRARWATRSLALGVTAGALGLLTYAYLPLRAASNTPVAWGDPQTWSRLWWVVSAAVFQKSVQAAPPAVVANLVEAALLLMEPLHPLGFVAAAVGALLLMRRSPRAGATLVLLAAGTALSQALMTPDSFNPDLHGYYLPVVCVLAVLTACCVAWLHAAVAATVPGGRRRWAQAALVGALALLPLRAWLHAEEPRAMARLRAPDMLASALLDRLPPHGVALTSDFSTVFLLWGHVANNAARPDVAIVHRNFLPFPGWAERDGRLHPNLLPWLLRLRDARGAVAAAGQPTRPLRVEPYHNLDTATAAGLVPDGLLHRLAPEAAVDASALESFWAELYDRLPTADLSDPQTRRYLFWQHVLQGRQCEQRGAPAAALAQWGRALNLAPGNPEVTAWMERLRRAHRGL